MTHIEWKTNGLYIRLAAPSDAPISLEYLAPSTADSSLIRGSQSLVELFTSREQRGRTSQGYVRSAVGDRLRYQEHNEGTYGSEQVLTIRQRDDDTGLEVETELSVPDDAAAVTVQHTVRNSSDSTVTLTAVSSLSVGIGEHEDIANELDLLWGESEWLAEGRWHEVPLRSVVPRLGLPIHAQNGRGRYSLTSHGAWSTGEFLPIGVMTERTSGLALAWEIETSAGWHWELGQGLDGLYLSALGPTDIEHHFATSIASGGQFTSVPATLAVSSAGRDGVVAELTAARRARRRVRPIDATLPVIYNDFMNTLMGDPTTEKLLPLIQAAADAGAEYFCIDAGWFAKDATWWDKVGEWREDPERFTGGLRAVIDSIHARGMRSGLWLEPEVIGVNSPIADSLPREAFFIRHGERVVEDRRYHLDFRHPAAREHLDRTVDHLVATYGISMLKLDYNINPGVGTDLDATGAGEGLLGHTLAYRDWLLSLYERHPDLLLENCSSGAMRMDQNLLAVTHLQSTSDQQNYELYPPIAVSAPLSLLPEQSGNWAYPTPEMTQEETVFAMASGLAGRLYLSGFLHTLRHEQQQLVAEAVALHKAWRGNLSQSSARWPLGLPGWDDNILLVELETATDALAVVWSRGSGEEIELPYAAMDQVYPAAEPAWRIRYTPQGRALLDVPDGRSARVFRVRR
ncbi:alpha-galactosidase [Arthrobacter sp. JZ12]|uniref:alpha-galactosidase n=1 Tax=Arthrobacter sp. JZ12 TaxID=2654190 RepID=UPI002B465D6B|nr:alpha-galactosidase [Arthrobacter sp. JZ12]WRH25333.1 alpha-galactosidase [Arthrobacter sp. JZ12]